MAELRAIDGINGPLPARSFKLSCCVCVVGYSARRSSLGPIDVDDSDRAPNVRLWAMAVTVRMKQYTHRRGELYSAI